MNRRDALKLGVASVAEIAATSSVRALPAADEAAPATQIIPLWPEGPPDGTDVAAALRAKNGNSPFTISADGALTNVADSRLTVFRPSHPDGSAMIVVPGGGYLRENVDPEGTAIARHFASFGITSFVLTYRLPGEGWPDRSEVALVDAERALSVANAAAQNFAIDSARIGILGFSAGGHIATLLATRGGGRLAFVALGYPVVTMLKPFAHEASREHLFGGETGDRTRAAFSCEQLVTSTTPPSFLFAADDDTDVPIENTLMLHASLRRARVPVELHLFERGGHGFGLGATAPISAWPDLFLRWGRSRGFFTG